MENIKHVGLIIKQIHDTVGKVVNKELKADDITFSQIRMLWTLKNSEGGTLTLKELEKSLRESVPDVGAKIIRVALGDIKLEDDVTQQWIEKWQAEGQRRMMELEAKGQAARISIETNARIHAQVKMIANTAKAFDSMAKYGEEIPSRFVILRFVEMIKRTSVEMLGKLYLPYDVVRTFEMLQKRIEGPKEEDAEDEGE